MKAFLAAVIAASFVLMSGCGAQTSTLAPAGRADTPALRALKTAGGIVGCPATPGAPSTPSTRASGSDSLPSKTVACLGGGPSVQLAALRGPMIVNVWGSWCMPCRQEMPVIGQFYRAYGKRVPVLGIDFQDDPESALRFAQKSGATYPQVVDFNGDVIRVRVLPATILIDAQGKAVFQQSLAITSVAELKDLVHKHLGIAL